MNKSVLLVEDEFYIRDLYRIVLEEAGLQVILAADGEEGLKLAQYQPDLILLDIMLPKMNGLMLLKKLKMEEKTKNIPVVLLTNLGQESVIKAAIDFGASGYLLKARLETTDLVSQVRHFLDYPLDKMDPDTLALD